MTRLFLLFAQWFFLPVLSNYLGLYESECSSEFNYILAPDLVNNGFFNLNAEVLVSDHLTPNHKQLIFENTLHQISQPFYFNISIEIELVYIGPEVECPKLLQVYPQGIQAVYVDSMNTSFSTVDLSQPYLSHAFALSHLFEDETMIDIIGLEHKDSNYSLSWTRLQSTGNKINLNFATEITNVSVPSEPLDIQLFRKESSSSSQWIVVLILYQESIEVYTLDQHARVFIGDGKIDITEFPGEKAFRFLFVEREANVLYFLTDNLLVSLDVDMIPNVDDAIQFNMSTINVMPFGSQKQSPMTPVYFWSLLSENKVESIRVSDLFIRDYTPLHSFGCIKNTMTKSSSLKTLELVSRNNFSCVIPFSLENQKEKEKIPFECYPILFPEDSSIVYSKTIDDNIFTHFSTPKEDGREVMMVYSKAFIVNPEQICPTLSIYSNFFRKYLEKDLVSFSSFSYLAVDVYPPYEKYSNIHKKLASFWFFPFHSGKFDKDDKKSTELISIETWLFESNHSLSSSGLMEPTVPEAPVGFQRFMSFSKELLLKKGQESYLYDMLSVEMNVNFLKEEGLSSFETFEFLVSIRNDGETLRICIYYLIISTGTFFAVFLFFFDFSKVPSIFRRKEKKENELIPKWEPTRTNYSDYGKMSDHLKAMDRQYLEECGGNIKDPFSNL